VRRRIVVENPCEEGESLCLDGTCRSGLCGFEIEEEEEEVVNTGPSITLRGEALVELDYGQAYAKCGPNPRLNEKCDRGVTAKDAEDGNTSSFHLKIR
jgi:hypothetical protein